MNGKSGSVAGLLVVAVMLPATLWAFQGQGRGGGGWHMGPPAEAIEACKGKAEGAEVEFTNRRGDKVSATCRMMPVPEGFPGEKGPRGMKGRMAQKLGLSDSQKQQIAGLLQAEQEKTAALRKQVEENRNQLQKAVFTLPFNEAAVKTLTVKQSELLADLILSWSRTGSEIAAVLTPEQRSQAEKLRLPMGPGSGQCFGCGMPRFGWEE